MNWLDLLLLILASYRMAYLIAYEDGPGALALKLRSWAHFRWSNTPHAWINDGVQCPLCLSFWIAPVLLTLLSVWPGGGPFVVWALGVAGGVLVLVRWQIMGK